MKKMFLILLVSLLFISLSSASVYYLTDINSSFPDCPTQKLLTKTPQTNLKTLWTGQFRSNLPLYSPYIQFLPFYGNIANTSNGIEIYNRNISIMNASSLGQGWLLNESLYRKTIDVQRILWNISTFYGTGQANDNNKFIYRVYVVNCSGGQFNLVKNLTNTNILFETNHSGGQEGWNSSTEQIYYQPASSSDCSISCRNFTQPIGIINNYTFKQGEYIFFEFGTGGANDLTMRSIGLRYNNSESFINIVNDIDINNFFENNISYTNTIYETVNNTLSINLTYNTIYNSISTTLIYNGTSYSSTSSGSGDTYVFNTSMISPNVNTSTNYSFYWRVALTNTTGIYYYNSTTYNQTVLPITVINVTTSCGSLNRSLFFRLQNEQNFSNLTGNINYKFTYGVNSSEETVFGSLSNVNNFSVCINSSAIPTFQIGYGEIQYFVNGYADRRYYIFNGTRISNSTTNITLYSLINTDQYSFQITTQDKSTIPYVGYYLSLIRWYPQYNQYNVVDMGLTDNKGQTVFHVEVDDVDYRIGLYYNNGTLVKLFDPIRMVCLDTTACTYTVIVKEDTTSYSELLNIDYTLTWNETTHYVQFIYSDPSQTTHTYNLSVYQIRGDKSILICSNSLEGYTGSIICDLTGYTGTFKVTVDRQSTPTFFIQKIIQMNTNNSLKSSYGLFISFLVGLEILLVTVVVSLNMALIGAVIMIIPAYFLGAIGLVQLGGVIVLAIIVYIIAEKA